MMHRVGQFRRPDAPASAKASGRQPDALSGQAPNTLGLSSSRFRELHMSGGTDMKLLPIVLAFAAVGVSAQTYYTGQADQERRDRNREEALESYRAGHMSATTGTYTTPHKHTVRGETHKAADATREAGHEVAEGAREVGHETANAARKAGHRTAEAARNTTDKVERKVGPNMNAGKANPDGINPKGVSSASPTAPSNGTTK